jgi:sulfite dehydrogenase (quinone) subunit SoeC
MVFEVLALCGYGLWMLLGLALAMGIYSTGRGDALVPLTLGCVFVSVGLVAACLRLPMAPDWHGWRLWAQQRPTREALLALATYLPMLGLAGLARGENEFWATRLACVALMVCSLACLVSSAYGYRRRRLSNRSHIAGQLPISRVLLAWYGGALWLWVCVIFQTDPSGHLMASWPWVIALLMMALLLGLVEGMGWQSFYPHGLGPRRFMAASLSCVIPCLTLPIVQIFPGGRWLALLAAAAYTIGKSLELGLYDRALINTADNAI